jgi:hypothetical protein
LPPVAAVLVTVVFDGDLDLFPTHVEVSDDVAELVVDHDLRLRSRQARMHEQQSKPGLLGRLRSGIYETEGSPRLPYATAAGIAL